MNSNDLRSLTDDELDSLIDSTHTRIGNENRDLRKYEDEKNRRAIERIKSIGGVVTESNGSP